MQPIENLDKVKSHEHEKFNELMSNIEMGLDVYQHGPTGSGKTFSCELASHKLGLPFYKKVVGSSMSESSIMGYMLPNGEYAPGVAYKPFTEGGVMLFDEVDNGNSNTNLILNGLSDGNVFFPCGMRERHPRFVLIATANTLGNGPSLNYVGRNRQDVALLNRFVFQYWPYDKELTYKISVDEIERKWSFDTENEKFWNKTNELNQLFVDVEKIQQVIEELQIQHIISPRTMKQAAIKVAWDRTLGEILNSVILKGLSHERKKKILEAAKNKKTKVENLPKFKKNADQEKREKEEQEREKKRQEEEKKEKSRKELEELEKKLEKEKQQREKDEVKARSEREQEHKRQEARRQAAQRASDNVGFMPSVDEINKMMEAMKNDQMKPLDSFLISGATIINPQDSKDKE